MEKKTIPIDDLVAGEVLGQDIYDENNKLLLKKGTVLLGVILDAFRKREIGNVYVMSYSPMPEIETSYTPPVSELEARAGGPAEYEEPAARASAGPSGETEPGATAAPASESSATIAAGPLERASTAVSAPAEEDSQALVHLGTFYSKLHYEMRRAMLRGQYNKILQDELPEAIGRMVALMTSMSDAQMIRFYIQAKNLYPESSFEVHGANVALLSTMLGFWLDDREVDIRELALSALLHDIGETQIPGGILTKRSRLTDAEWSLVKTHPLISAKIMNKNKWASPRMMTWVLRHHERLDGTGYPYSLLGAEIPRGARIIAAAGSFDAMTSERPFRRAMSLFGALADLKNRSFGQLDALITRTLYEKFLHYYMGRKVELSNGDQGTITMLAAARNDEKLLVKGQRGYYQMTDRDAPAIRRIVEGGAF